jgi:hypothetical protein
MADGDPVTATSPVENGNRCQFLLQCTFLTIPPSELALGALCKLRMSLCDGSDTLDGFQTRVQAGLLPVR